MLDVLVESRPAHAWRRSEMLVSPLALVAHLAAAVVVVLSAHAVSASLDVARLDTTLVFLRPPTEAPKPPPPAPKVVEQVAAATVPAVAPPKGFQTVVAPTEIPKAIPPVDLNEKPFDPRDFTGKGVEGGVADGVVGGVLGAAKGDAVESPGTAVYRAVDLDVPVALIEQPPLRYPPMLADAGIDGVVDLEFVVGVDGRVEPASIRVIASSQPQFVAEARTVALGSRFRAARLHHQAVRQLVAQRYRFTVAR
ncbi:MAG TPA: TonB family protein [Gemmatimonadales bacterium]|nr:TonB family protein [Gemmatimonadales bacterium]